MKKLLLAFLFIPSLFAQSPIILAPTVPTNTYNLSIRNIDNAMFRIMQEMTMMVSSRATAISVDDKDRLDEFYKYLVDLVETSTASMSDLHYLATMQLSDVASAVKKIENPALQAAINHMLGANVNLRISQSNRINDSLIEKDKEDLLGAITKSKTYIDDFFMNDNPLDFNQSSPFTEVVNPMQLP